MCPKYLSVNHLESWVQSTHTAIFLHGGHGLSSCPTDALCHPGVHTEIQARDPFPDQPLKKLEVLERWKPWRFTVGLASLVVAASNDYSKMISYDFYWGDCWRFNTALSNPNSFGRRVVASLICRFMVGISWDSMSKCACKLATCFSPNMCCTRRQVQWPYKGGLNSSRNREDSTMKGTTQRCLAVFV